MGRVRSQAARERRLGFTLIELLIALSLGATAVVGVLGLVRVATQAAVLTEGRLDAQQHARRAMDRMVEELRWGEAVVPSALCPSGLCADRVSVRIPSGNPYRQDQGYEVTFQHNPRQREAERRVGRGVNNLASLIERLEVAYLDTAGSPAADPAAVVRLRITLTAVPPRGTPITLQSEVALRNRRLLPAAPPSPPAVPPWRPTPRQIPYSP
ncbi:MAG: prepilin-type N-terminal cleavage/methylation domain-containing protein [Armatimonadota bacterium]|nr:prepilin-type N-terminal cleavage/methylation domain-containing protein [Armatimonadota bacterium]MDR7549464.1 prepilin-type N-terminal cleavage/methylation domain-containing protein [Armatimonadota bacterium]